MIDGCRLVSQSYYLNNSNKDCDWLILTCFIREQSMLTPLFLVWKIKFGLKIQRHAWGNYWILYHKTNKKASTDTKESVEHLRRRETHSTTSRVFLYTCFVLYRFLRALQHNRAQSRLLYLLIKLAGGQYRGEGDFLSTGR